MTLRVFGFETRQRNETIQIPATAVEEEDGWWIVKRHDEAARMPTYRTHIVEFHPREMSNSMRGLVPARGSRAPRRGWSCGAGRIRGAPIRSISFHPSSEWFPSLRFRVEQRVPHQSDGAKVCRRTFPDM